MGCLVSTVPKEGLDWVEIRSLCFCLFSRNLCSNTSCWHKWCGDMCFLWLLELVLQELVFLYQCLILIWKKSCLECYILLKIMENIQKVVVYSCIQYGRWNSLLFFILFLFCDEVIVLLYCGLLSALKTWGWVAANSTGKFLWLCLLVV